MDDVSQIYNDNKLLIRAMDFPSLRRNGKIFEYDCTIWANEFELLSTTGLNSASTTLIIPNVGVSTYKSIGFLLNSDLVNCFHIALSDSGSRGNLENGNFSANKADYETIEQLSNYIKENNHTEMNEVNVVANLDSIVGLFINKCQNQDYLLSRIYIIQKCLKDMLDIEYPIYLYDRSLGRIEKIELTAELEEQIISTLKTSNICYWPDNCEEPIEFDLKDNKNKML